MNIEFATYRVAKGNLDFLKNMLLLKNPQFLPNQYETLSKKGTCECLILTKFCNGRVKIVDFLIKAYFCLSPDLHVSECRIGRIYFQKCLDDNYEAKNAFKQLRFLRNIFILTFFNDMALMSIHDDFCQLPSNWNVIF